MNIGQLYVVNRMEICAPTLRYITTHIVCTGIYVICILTVQHPAWGHETHWTRCACTVLWHSYQI